MGWYKKANVENIGFTNVLGPTEDGIWLVKAVDVEKSKVIGILEIERLPDPYNRWEAVNVRVLPEYQRQGVATFLLQVAYRYFGENLYFDRKGATLDSGIQLIHGLEEKGLVEGDYYTFKNDKTPINMIPNNKKKYQVGEDLNPYDPITL
jgi:GNAT superfamily N-acetyltransferase